MAITPKQEHFCQCVADGMTQADAYRTAFEVKPNTKASSVIVNASKLMSDANIAQRVKELQTKLTEKNLWTREQSVNALLEAYRVAMEERQSTGMTAATKELNAMHGYNQPIKHDVNVTTLPTIIFKERDDAD